MKTLLLDLDNTLLAISMSRFIQEYMPLLGEHMAEIAPLEPVEIVSGVFMATRAMINNVDPAVTNNDLFWQELEKQTKIDWLALDAPAHANAFYHDGYHALRPLTSPKPAARELIEWALEQGLEVVVATNPLYPKAGIRGRMQWAEVDDFPFKLVTHSENMHATKPNKAYYREILQRIGREPAEAIMVGDDWKSDIEPAAAVGMRTFWIAPQGKALPAEGVAQGRGELENSLAWLKESVL